jgi:hypothetical protein
MIKMAKMRDFEVVSNRYDFNSVDWHLTGGNYTSQ